MNQQGERGNVSETGARGGTGGPIEIEEADKDITTTSSSKKFRLRVLLTIEEDATAKLGLLGSCL